MKKYCLAIALVALLALVGCAEHEHSWKEEVVKKATCGASGLKVYTCEVCEATREEEIPATGEHSYELKTLKEADCVNDGSKQEVCSVCGAKGSPEVIEAAHKYDAGDECTVCHNKKADIESAEARIGTKYYQTFKEAVFAAVNATEDDKKTVEVLAKSINTGAHLTVNGSITINANGCDFSDSFENLAIYTYKEGTISDASKEDVSEHGKNIRIVINNAKNLSIWGSLRASDSQDVISVVLNDCHNDGKTLLMLRASGLDVGAVELTMNGCSAKNIKGDSIHSDIAQKVVVSNCQFDNCYIPINLSYNQKGKCSVLIEDSKFTACGLNDGTEMAKYSAPVRIINKSSAVETEVSIKGVSVNDTVSTLGDILLVDSRAGKTFKALSSTFEGNKTDLNVKVSVDGDLETVAAGVSATLTVEVPTT